MPLIQNWPEAAVYGFLGVSSIIGTVYIFLQVIQQRGEVARQKVIVERNKSDTAADLHLKVDSLVERMDSHEGADELRFLERKEELKEFKDSILEININAKLAVLLERTEKTDTTVQQLLRMKLGLSPGGLKED